MPPPCDRDLGKTQRMVFVKTKAYLMLRQLIELNSAQPAALNQLLFQSSYSSGGRPQ